VRTQLVDGLLADLLQDVRFLRVYKTESDSFDICICPMNMNVMVVVYACSCKDIMITKHILI
jgi:hypothetical protein